jgi:hypothetical protein
MLKFDWSKRVPRVWKGVKRESFKNFTMNSGNNKVIVISQLLRKVSNSIFRPDIYERVQTVIVFNRMHK